MLLGGGLLGGCRAGYVLKAGYYQLELLSLREEAVLALKGWDVHRGRVGGCSTLGWFDDPILPQMLSCPDVALQNLVFHELTHATLWLPGSPSQCSCPLLLQGIHGALPFAK